MYKLPAQGIDAPNEALEQKLMWMREAASERFESLELSQMALCLLSMLVELRGMLRETGPPIPRVAEKTLHASAIADRR